MVSGGGMILSQMKLLPDPNQKAGGLKTREEAKASSLVVSILIDIRDNRSAGLLKMKEEGVRPPPSALPWRYEMENAIAVHSASERERAEREIFVQKLVAKARKIPYEGPIGVRMILPDRIGRN